jgi:hypothetical protein
VRIGGLTPLLRQVSRAGIEITVIRNVKQSGIANNTNGGVTGASGTHVHPLFYDDFLPDPNFYLRAQSAFAFEDVSWVVAPSLIHVPALKSSQRILDPHLHEYSYLGINTIGPPSSMVFRRGHWVEMDPRLTVLVDCQFYEGIRAIHGMPSTLKNTHVGVTTWHGQTQRSDMRHALRQEYKIIFESRKGISSLDVFRAGKILWHRGNKAMAKALLAAYASPRTSRGAANR